MSGKKQLLTAYCPICREEGYVGINDITEPYYVCGMCRLEVLSCNEHNGITCFECINEFVTGHIDDLDNLKTTKRYGCHKGSRFMQLVKKHNLTKLQCKQLLKWKVYKLQEVRA